MGIYDAAQERLSDGGIITPDTVVKTAIHEYECNVIGIRDGYDGFLNLDSMIITRGRWISIGDESCSPLLIGEAAEGVG